MVYSAFGLLNVIHDTSASFPSINILQRLILFIFEISGTWVLKILNTNKQVALGAQASYIRGRQAHLLLVLNIFNTANDWPKLFMNNSYANYYCNYRWNQIYCLYCIDTCWPLIRFGNGNCLLSVVYQEFICWIEFQSWFNACSWT